MITLGSCEPDKKQEEETVKGKPLISKVTTGGGKDEVTAIWLATPSSLGKLSLERDTHYWSNGAFNLVQLLLYVLGQIGPSHLIMSSYSFGSDAVTALKRHMDKGELLSVRFLIDNRVKSLSPKPFEQLTTSFPGAVRCTSVHAKVVCLWNDETYVSIVGSQNATNNPKLERGTIFVNREVFDFDRQNLEIAWENGFE